MIAVPMILARGFSFPPVGQSARGVGYLPGIPRCTLEYGCGPLCQELPQNGLTDAPDRLPGLGGIFLEALFAADEALDLHAPSIRMEMGACRKKIGSETFGLPRTGR